MQLMWNFCETFGVPLVLQTTSLEDMCGHRTYVCWQNSFLASKCSCSLLLFNNLDVPCCSPFTQATIEQLCTKCTFRLPSSSSEFPCTSTNHQGSETNVLKKKGNMSCIAPQWYYFILGVQNKSWNGNRCTLHCLNMNVDSSGYCTRSYSFQILMHQAKDLYDKRFKSTSQ